MTYHNRIIVLSLAAWILLSSPEPASAQTTEMSLRINNSPPNAYGMHAAPMIRSAGADVVWCQATIEDLNGFQDMRLVSAHLLTPAGETYRPKTDTTPVRVEEETDTMGTAVAGFVIDPQAPEGEWTCVIDVGDTASENATGRTTFNVYPQRCLKKADCGNGCPPCTCFDGEKDHGETRTDCGGPCAPCALQDKLILSAPSAVYKGETLPFKVEIRQEPGLKAAATIVRVRSPSGKVTAYKANESGSLTLSIPADETGKWDVKADLFAIEQTQEQTQAQTQTQTQEQAQVQVDVKTPPRTYLTRVLAALAIIAAATLIDKKIREKRGNSRPNHP